MEVSQSNTVCPWDDNNEVTATNICPWESSVPPPSSVVNNPPIKLADQRLTNPKLRPDRSKSVDVSSLGKRQGSVSQVPSLGPVPSESHPLASVCPWENQELPNRTTEKSKSIDVDVCPWETNESEKKSSTCSAPGIIAGDSQATCSVGASLSKQQEHSDKSFVGVVLIGKEKGNKDISRPPCEKKISIQVCPWEEVEEEDSQASDTHSSSFSEKAQSDSNVEQITKVKEKFLAMNTNMVVNCGSNESHSKSENLSMQTSYEPRQGVGSEGTSSPSSTCSSSSYSDSRRIKIDYTVRSGHLPGQYGLPVSPTPASHASPASQQTQHGQATTTLSSGNTSTTSSNSSAAGIHHGRAESPRDTDKLPHPSEEGNKPPSPRVATSVVVPWEENPSQKVTDICPWEDE